MPEKPTQIKYGQTLEMYIITASAMRIIVTLYFISREPGLLTLYLKWSLVIVLQAFLRSFNGPFGSNCC